MYINNIMKIITIIQARMGSTRLPGKTLKPINGIPILKRTVDRLQKSALLSQVIIATSTNIENNIIEEFCLHNNIKYYRGSENDLLDRYYHSALKYGCNEKDIIVRITSDCPLIDSIVVDNAILHYMHNDFDVVLNSWFKNSYPSGFDVEVLNFNVLHKIWSTETDMTRREHVLCSRTNKLLVTNMFSDIPSEYILSLNFDINLIHLSVDTKEDFILIDTIIKNMPPNYTFYDVVDYLNNNVDLITNITDKRKAVMKKLKS